MLFVLSYGLLFQLSLLRTLFSRTFVFHYYNYYLQIISLVVVATSVHPEHFNWQLLILISFLCAAFEMFRLISFLLFNSTVKTSQLYPDKSDAVFIVL